jgi:hypothetical protein
MAALLCHSFLKDLRILAVWTCFERTFLPSIPGYPKEHYILCIFLGFTRLSWDKVNIKIKMDLEHWWSQTNTGNPKCLDKNVSKYHFVHHRYCKKLLGKNPSPCVERQVTEPEPRYGLLRTGVHYIACMWWKTVFNSQKTYSVFIIKT